jgi:hypothetical protein
LGFVLEISHELKGKGAFGIDTLEEVNKWFNALKEASHLKENNDCCKIKSLCECGEFY